MRRIELQSDVRIVPTTSIPRECRGMYDGETATIVKKIPEIDCDGSTNSDEREQTDVFRTHDKRKCHARSNKPCPPLFRECLMSIGVEFDIHPNRHRNTKHQRRIQKNQSLLCQLRIIYLLILQPPKSGATYRNKPLRLQRDRQRVHTRNHA